MVLKTRSWRRLTIESKFSPRAAMLPGVNMERYVMGTGEVWLSFRYACGDPPDAEGCLHPTTPTFA